MSRTGAVRLAAAVALLVAIALPLVFALLASFAPERELYRGHGLAPSELTTAHYRTLFTERDFWTPVRNSLVVAAATTFLCVAIASACAYALARLRFRGRRLVLGAMLAVSMFPQISIVGPLYLLLREVGLIDTYPGLVLPYLTFALPLAVWLLVGYFRQLPSDLEDAAIVDGASRLRVLWEIVLPLAAPGIATTAILTFVYCWNEFLFALSFTTTHERQTVPVAVALFRGQFQVPWGQILAATIISTLPVLVLVAAFQRRILGGLTAGSVK
ncbi:MAG TPA: carbohydrate ABC transporter permease [Kofleriaceae bacterium]|nr:carbohydrate ABC transporter permease [Kofleriaceae bacterium]